MLIFIISGAAPDAKRPYYHSYYLDKNNIQCGYP